MEAVREVALGRQVVEVEVGPGDAATAPAPTVLALVVAEGRHVVRVEPVDGPAGRPLLEVEAASVLSGAVRP